VAVIRDRIQWNLSVRWKVGYFLNMWATNDFCSFAQAAMWTSHECASDTRSLDPIVVRENALLKTVCSSSGPAALECPNLQHGEPFLHHSGCRPTSVPSERYLKTSFSLSVAGH